MLDSHDREIIERATIAMATEILMEHSHRTLVASTARLHDLAQILSIPVFDMASAIIDSHPLPQRSGGTPGVGSTGDA